MSKSGTPPKIRRRKLTDDSLVAMVRKVPVNLDARWGDILKGEASEEWISFLEKHYPEPLGRGIRMEDFFLLHAQGPGWASAYTGSRLEGWVNRHRFCLFPAHPRQLIAIVKHIPDLASRLGREVLKETEGWHRGQMYSSPDWEERQIYASLPYNDEWFMGVFGIACVGKEARKWRALSWSRGGGPVVWFVLAREGVGWEEVNSTYSRALRHPQPDYMPGRRPDVVEFWKCPGAWIARGGRY